MPPPDVAPNHRSCRLPEHRRQQAQRTWPMDVDDRARNWAAHRLLEERECTARVLQWCTGNRVTLLAISIVSEYSNRVPSSEPGGRRRPGQSRRRPTPPEAPSRTCGGTRHNIKRRRTSVTRQATLVGTTSHGEMCQHSGDWCLLHAHCTAVARSGTQRCRRCPAGLLHAKWVEHAPGSVAMSYFCGNWNLNLDLVYDFLLAQVLARSAASGSVGLHLRCGDRGRL